MKPFLRLTLSVSLAGAAVLAPYANAMRIEGIPPFELLATHAVVPVVKSDGLNIPILNKGHLTIEPWPMFLPQRFDEQTINAQRKLLPAGPSDRISFTKTGETDAWLLIGNGSRRSETVIGDWKLQLSDGKWYVAAGTRMKRLASEDGSKRGAASIQVDQECWLVYLLDSKAEAQQSSIASEHEPQISWAAIREQSKQCSP